MTSTTAGRFAGKTVIVIGEGVGIGRATATRIARDGSRLSGSGVLSERLDEIKAELVGLDFIPVTGDVCSETTISEIMAAAGDRGDGLANRAGIMDGFLPTAEIDDETCNRMRGVTLSGPTKLSPTVIPLMRDAHCGAIVNVSSEAGLRGTAAGTVSTTSKHAINGQTKSTAFLLCGHRNPVRRGGSRGHRDQRRISVHIAVRRGTSLAVYADQRSTRCIAR